MALDLPKFKEDLQKDAGISKNDTAGLAAMAAIAARIDAYIRSATVTVTMTTMTGTSVSGGAVAGTPGSTVPGTIS